MNILGEHQEELSPLFATKGADRFGQTDWHLGVGGSPVLHDTLAYLDCEFWAEYDGGDHIIVVGRVLDLGIAARRRPAPLLPRPVRPHLRGMTPASLDGRVVVVGVEQRASAVSRWVSAAPPSSWSAPIRTRSARSSATS